MINYVVKSNVSLYKAVSDPDAGDYMDFVKDYDMFFTHVVANSASEALHVAAKSYEGFDLKKVSENEEIGHAIFEARKGEMVYVHESYCFVEVGASAH